MPIKPVGATYQVARRPAHTKYTLRTGDSAKDDVRTGESVEAVEKPIHPHPKSLPEREGLFSAKIAHLISPSLIFGEGAGGWGLYFNRLRWLAPPTNIPTPRPSSV